MNQALMAKIQRMQKELKEGQQKIEESEYEGSATGVSVILQGNKTVLQVLISDELLLDKEILQDSILVAVNNAIEKIDKDTEELYSKFKALGIGF